jgi:hypothetical protein
MNFQKTKDSGFLTRKLSLLALDNIINMDVEDCGTKFTIPVKIDSAKTLKKLNKRKYYMKDKKKMRTINYKEDFSNLENKTIYLRSPITCACKYGICKTCYGDLYKYNHDFNVGIVGVLLLTSKLTQLNLSAKHNIQAKANKINWSEDFQNYFTVNKSEISYSGNSGVKIFIKEFYENEESYDNQIEFDHLVIVDGKKEIELESPVLLRINQEIINIDDIHDIKNDQYIINTKDYFESDTIFLYTMDNNELNATLNAITKLIETNYFIKSHTIDEVTNEFYRLLNSSPIDVDFVHIEIILKDLCKIKDDDRTLFARGDKIPVEDINVVVDSIINNPALSKSIVFQDFYKQITQMVSTYDKTQYSVLDETLK